MPHSARHFSKINLVLTGHKHIPYQTLVLTW